MTNIDPNKIIKSEPRVLPLVDKNKIERSRPVGGSAWTWFWIAMVILLIILGGLHRTKAQSPAEVLKMCQDIGVQHPEIVTAQSVLETGWYGCGSCSMDQNNIFGFRWKGEYLVFAHWRRSVWYYKHWQDRHYTGGDYYDFLIDRGYATDPNYITKLKAIHV